jgi:type II secretory pathway component PulJ
VRSRGFTVLEVTIAATLFLVMLGSAAVALSIDTKTEQVLNAQVSPEIAARTALERITTELRMAGVRGEDRNGDGVLNPSEDLNGNGVLDSDWNLEDGTAQSTVTFNRRIEVRLSKSEVVAQSEYSRAVTYRLEADRLVRIAREVPPGETEPRITRSVLARKIARLQFERSNAVITVTLDVTLPKGVYKSDIRTLEMSVRLRN